MKYQIHEQNSFIPCRLTLLNKLLEDGNTLFKRNQLAEAAQRYTYAAKRVPSSTEGAHKAVFDQLRIHLLLNLSRCRRKMKEYEEAIKLATEVITDYPSCYEAFHARAKANHAAGNLDESLHDLTEAVKVAPQNRELHKILIALKEDIQNRSVPANSDDKCDYPESSSGVFTRSGQSTKI